MNTLIKPIFLFFSLILMMACSQNKPDSFKEKSISADSLSLSDPFMDSIVRRSELFNKKNHDLDGDGKADNISFSYSEGAHCCYQLSVLLSSDSSETQYPFQMDGGYVFGVDDSRPDHFNIKDYDNDGRVEIFMEIETYNFEKSPIPEKWNKQYGITTNYIIVEYEKGKLIQYSLPWSLSPEQYFLSRSFPKDPGKLHVFKKDGLFGYQDEKGKTVILNCLHKANPFSAGVAIVAINEQNYLISKKGEIISDFKHFYLLDSVFHDGLLPLFDVDKFFYMNTKGEIINKTPYLDIHPFSEGLASVQDPKTKKYGYINPANQWVIQPVFEMAQPFENARAFVDNGKEMFWIDKKGKRKS